MSNLKLSEVNDQAIKQWKKQTASQPVKSRTPKEPKSTLPRGDTRPPQIKDIRPMGKSLSEVVFSKRHGRYMEKRTIAASANWGYAQNTVEWYEISEKKRKAIEAIDQAQEADRARRYKGHKMSSDNEVTLKDLGL